MQPNFKMFDVASSEKRLQIMATMAATIIYL